MWCHPLTRISALEPDLAKVGVPQVGTSVRAVRQSCLPFLSSKTAKNEFVCTSHSTTTLSPWITGELANPHWALGTI